MLDSSSRWTRPLWPARLPRSAMTARLDVGLVRPIWYKRNAISIRPRCSPPMVRCGVASVCVSEVTDFAALGERWRDLEHRSEGSFFQSWTWVGCLAAERFSDAVLVEAIEAGRTVALGLFNRVRHRVGPPTLFLGENGTTELDCPYVEQNGILTEAGCDADLTALCLRSLAAAHDVVLSGVGAPVFVAARLAACLVLTRRSQVSPFIDLAAVRRAGGDYLAGRSANTRQQIRR